VCCTTDIGKAFAALVRTASSTKQTRLEGDWPQIRPATGGQLRVKKTKKKVKKRAEAEA